MVPQMDLRMMLVIIWALVVPDTAPVEKIHYLQSK